MRGGLRIAGTAALVLTMAGVAGGCDALASVGPPSPSPTLTPTLAVPPTAPVASPVEGVVIDVATSGLTEVSGFTLRTGSQEVEFTIGELENGLEFPPSHLVVHMADSFPIRVFFRPTGADLVVYRLEDAVAAP